MNNFIWDTPKTIPTIIEKHRLTSFPKEKKLTMAHINWLAIK